MALLAPAMLWALAALAGPILLHLLRRRQVRTIRFASLRFLKAIATRTSRMAKIENLLLLFLRCLLFALLALAFARPVLQSGARWLPGAHVPRTVVLIVDHSMSMNYQDGGTTRLEIAKKEALTILKKLKEDDRVAVLAANDRVEQPLGEPSLDHAQAARAIEQIAASQAGTDFSPALLRARKILSNSPRGRRQIFLLTDNQETGWKFDHATVFDPAWKNLEIEFVTVKPDRTAASNDSVQELKIPSPVFLPGATTQAVATVRNAADSPLQDVLAFESEGERVAQQPFEAAAQGTADVPVEFTVPVTAARWIGGSAGISPDHLPDDDHYFYARPVYQERPSLIVTSGQALAGRMRPDFYLRKALSVAGGTPVSITPEALNDLSLDSFGVVFLADPGSLNDRAVVKLSQFLQNGGTVVFFPGDRTTAENTANLDFLPAKPDGLHELPAGRQPARIMDPAHPLFANVWDANTPFPALPQRMAMRWKPGESAKLLLALGEAEPFLLGARQGSGLVLVFNATADRTWGDFPLSPAFVPLLQQIRLLAAGDSGSRPAYLVGSPIPWPPEISTEESATVLLPDRSTRTLPPNEQNVLLDRADLAGVYRVRTGRDETAFAVNVDTRESNLAALSGEALSRIVAQTTLEGPADLESWLDTDHGVRPLWPALLALAALVFCAEFLASNYFAFRRTQGGEAPLRTGRLVRRQSHPAPSGSLT